MSGSDSESMKKIEARINAVLAEKAALESKLARMEASYKSEIEAVKQASAGGEGVQILAAGMFEEQGPEQK